MDFALEKLHTNQRLLIEELLSRNVAINPIEAEIELFEADFCGHHEYIFDRSSSINSGPHSKITGDKFLTKGFLKKAGINTPLGNVFDINTLDEALDFTKRYLKFPVVLKPNWGSHGDNIRMDISSILELEKAIIAFLKQCGNDTPFIIEEQFSGFEHRIFITKNGDYAVLRRVPAFVVGDSSSTIKELVNKENLRRASAYETDRLCPIVIDENYIKDTDYIPARGAICYVRSISNLAKGGVPEDMTDMVHLSVIEIAKKALESIKGLPYAGIDFLTEDITKKQDSSSYSIIEINSNPGFSMHMYPHSGKPRNIASYVADLIFPETKKALI